MSDNYTYVGKDYPREYPISEEIQLVAMTLHESVHFSLSPSDNIAVEEWKSLGYPVHHGKTHLGPDYRLFSTVFGHQMHCLQTLYLGLQHQYRRSNDITRVDRHHLQHCLNYLRQTFMCEAAETLEEGNFLLRNFTEHIDGGTLICRDWSSVLQVLNERQSSWEESKPGWHGGGPRP